MPPVLEMEGEMSKLGFAVGMALANLAGAAMAQAAAAPKPVVIESYYRVKWGNSDEFKRLYERNEMALLRDMQRQGFILDLRFEEPYTHMAGSPRWDYRARITYRDGIAAVEAGGSYDKAFEAARARLLPDKAKFDAEQSRRMSLLEEHWDVVVTPAGE